MKKDVFYFYKITNNLTGKFYYGVHATCSTSKDRYMGSGKYLQRSQKKYGLRHFSKEILRYFSSPEEMYNYEASFITKDFLIKNHSMCYNLICGGKGGTLGTVYIEKDGTFMRILPEFLEEFLNKGWQCKGTSKGRVSVRKDGKTIFISSENLQEYLESGWKQEGNSKELIKIHNEYEQKFVASEDLESYLKEGWILGTPDSERIHQSKAIKGRIHINNGNEAKMVFPEDLEKYFNQGWKRGRLLDEHTYADKISKALTGIKRSEEAKERYRVSKQGCRYMNNGTTNKMVKSENLDSYLKSGWKFGMVKI